MLSDVFLTKLRACRTPIYRLAEQAGTDKFWVSRLVTFDAAIKAHDPRILKLGKALGLKAYEVFERGDAM